MTPAYAPESGQAVTDAELIAYAKERLAAYKVPKSIEFVEHMPRSDAGKLNRNTLVRERAGQGEAD